MNMDRSDSIPDVRPGFRIPLMTALLPFFFVCLFSLATLILTAPAGAGDVTAHLCPGPSAARSTGQFLDQGGRPWLDVEIGCHAAGDGIVGLYQDRDGASAGSGKGGSIVWESPPEVSITRASGRVRMRDANGIRTVLNGTAGGASRKIEEGAALDGTATDFAWPRSGSPGSSLAISITCIRSGGCPNQRDSTRSFVQVERLEIEGLDATPPLVELSGELDDVPGRWVGGHLGFSAYARDHGTGVAETFFLVNGSSVPIPGVPCTGIVDGRATRLDPCPAAVFPAGALDTSKPPFRQGTNSIRLCANDFASDPRTANRTCTERFEIKVDGLTPSAPLDLETDRGTGWSARGDFNLSWVLPYDSGSPLDRAVYRVRDVATGRVVLTGAMSADPSAAGGSREVTVPEPGDYRLELGFVDAAGNRGPVATTPVRFDDRPPPDVEPATGAGWVSRAELPLSQSVKPPSGAGASGIAGFALTASDVGPRRPCLASRCRLSELSWLGGPDEGPALLDGLVEGVNTVSAVAVSGAMVPSLNPGVTPVKVDLTDPVVAVTGNHPGWSSRPVTLTAIATDRLSGMAPNPQEGVDEVPVTGIGVSGADPVVRVGGRSSLTVTGEGVTEVEAFARDLAGNSTRRSERTVVRIDSVPPSIGLPPEPDPLDPEKVVASIEDGASGLADGEISIGPKGGRAGFRTLATTTGPDRLEARIPSDDLAPGDYVLRVEATDVAGNRSVVTSDSPLRLPLKEETTLSLSSHRPEVSTGTTGHGISGRVMAGGGLSVGSSVVIEEAFPPGSGLPTRTTEVPVGDDGKFSLALQAGPIRRVRATFGGDRLNRRASSRWLQLDSEDRVLFVVRNRTTRNGAPTRMSGSVSGPGSTMPTQGKKIVIQYFDPSRRAWRPVEIVTANAAGRFGFTYRFRTITSRQRILFRASSIGEAGWPFTPTASRPVSVVVLP